MNTPEIANIRAIDLLAFNWHGVFAHGKLQENLMDDRISSSVDLSTIPDGISNPECKGVPCIAYLWSIGSKRRGLIVYAYDGKAIRYAREKFEALSPTL